MLPMIALLLVAVDSPPRDMIVEELDDGRFRFTVTYSARASPAVQARMQLRLMEQAERQCRGRGRAVSSGALEANQAPGGRIALSEIYSCEPR